MFYVLTLSRAGAGIGLTRRTLSEFIVIKW